ncbi:hypothetical protein AUK10_00300 [Candidatus Gracilibacteria bacterium CG2_30_37_12]|nr:MAG: hypothetical protein AUK10_00300 [Candidatus Gracilibacteria bacterium CG2_30_37_12]
MKQVLSYSITLIPDTDPFDNQYFFQVATDISSPIIIDLAEVLKEFRNDRVDFKKDYKLWNQVYPTEKELELFQEIVEKALIKRKKVHIINCTLREEVQIIRELYEKLGYFDEKENRFMVPFITAPVTIGVNIRNLVYSTKDYKSKREQICFIPPPREPGHVKTLFAAINSWMISTVNMNDISQEKELLKTLLDTEKINLTILAQVLSGNYLEMGCQIGKKEEWILKL